MRRIRGGRRGGVLIIALFLMAALAVAMGVTAEINSAALRTADEQREGDLLDRAATSVVAALTGQLAQSVALRLGLLGQSDVDAINAGLGSLPSLPTGTTLLTGPDDTGVRLVGFRRMEPIPHDERVVELWTDHLRRSFTSIPPQTGRIASETYTFLIHAAVSGRNGAVGRARVRVAVSRVPAHQDALYVAGDAYVCATSSGRIHGSATIDGTLVLGDCGGSVTYTGSVAIGEDLVVGGSHRVDAPTGSVPLTSISSATAESDPDQVTDAFAGRLRFAAAVGARRPSSRFSSGAVAGVGECLDFTYGGSDVCNGAAAFHPSLAVIGHPTGFLYSCGEGFSGNGCSTAVGALTWHPLPPGAAGAAAFPWAMDPPEAFWKGFFPDARREARCEARLAAGTAWRSYRCPTNAWGWKLDAAALPVIPGGVLAVHRGLGYGTQSVAQTLVIENAQELQGPLSIISQVPVAIVGSFNVLNPKPALIHAPRISALPNEAPFQLRTTAVWDSVPPAGMSSEWALPLVAQSNVTIYAVLRTSSCNVIGSEDFGGSFRAAPAVLGDWSRVGLRIIGAVEVQDETPAGRAECGSWWGPLNAPALSGTPTVEPRSREILYDPRLLDSRWQPPGSWRPENIPTPHAAGAPSRTAARQANAHGGFVLFRQGGDVVLGQGSLLPAIPFPTATPGLAAAPPPLP